MDYYRELFSKLGYTISPTLYFYISIGFILLSFLSIWNIYFSIMFLIGFLMLIYPIIDYKNRISYIEAYLPRFLLDLGQSLTIGLSLEQSIKNSIKSSPYFSKIFKVFAKRLEEKETYQSVFLSFASVYNSPLIVRSMAQLISSLNSGSPKEIIQLSNELLKEEVIKMKEYLNKIQILIQFFISISIILPILTIFFLILGSSIETGQLNIDKDEIFKILFLILPIVMAIFILTVRLITPVFSFYNPKLNLAFFLSAWTLSLSTFIVTVDTIKYLLFLFTLALIFVLYKPFLVERYINRLEQDIPKVGLIISTAPDFNIRNIFLSIANTKGLNEANKLFKIAFRKLESGISISEVFKFLKSTKSSVFYNFITNLEFIYNIGESSKERISQWVDSYNQIYFAKEEGLSNIGIYKYTLIIGALLLPIIFNMFFSIIFKMFKEDISYIYWFVFIPIGAIYTLISIFDDKPENYLLYIISLIYSLFLFRFDTGI